MHWSLTDYPEHEPISEHSVHCGLMGLRYVTSLDYCAN